ncbi:MAG TPA: delta-60 repeat domain-containing protein, partial [Rhodanobacteraceae bacterium]|nr:delta-60 repeat domain-containing protein [Rhodanobacteraceae bacterium]
MLILVVLSTPFSVGLAQSVNDGFDPNVNGGVDALALQPDGRLVLAGAFSALAPNGAPSVGRNNIARLNADGGVDATFDPNANGYVYALAVQADGKIIIGGAFTGIAPNGGASVPRKHLARLNIDGSADPTFDPSSSGDVNVIALQSDGSILVGGAFTSMAPNGGPSVLRRYLARLNADGSLDATFDPDPNSAVLALALQQDGQIVAGGSFTSLAPNGGATVARSRLARLHSDGTLDATFDPAANSSVFSLAVYADGKIAAGGAFTALTPNGSTAIGRNYIARLNVDGSVDPGFDPHADNSVAATALQPDGKLIVGGYFEHLAPNGGASIARKHLVRLDADGHVDTGFDPSANDVVYAVEVQQDGAILAGGLFTGFAANGTSIARNHLARLNPDSTLDGTFNPHASDAVSALMLQPDGRIVVSGTFTYLDPNDPYILDREHIARVKPDGSVDAFDPHANDTVRALGLQADGKVVFGGAFITVALSSRNYIARVTADGVLDMGFDPNADSNVDALVVQADGRIVIGGEFTHLAPFGGAVRTHHYIARLDSQYGTVDDSYTLGTDGPVDVLALQSDGKVLLGGSFGGLSPAVGYPYSARNNIARLNVDGTLDDAFNPNANGSVSALAVQSDGKILVGGSFSQFAPNNGPSVSHIGMVRLNSDGSVDPTFTQNVYGGSVHAFAPQRDGGIIIGGFFSQVVSEPDFVSRNNLARLSANGVVDAAFDPNPNGPVSALALQADGKVIVGGSFTSFSPPGEAIVDRRCVARISATAPALQTLELIGYSAGGSTVNWRISGSGTQIASAPQLKLSLDAAAYNLVGTMQPAPAGWTYRGLAAPLNQVFYVKVVAASSSGNALESTRQF